MGQLLEKEDAALLVAASTGRHSKDMAPDALSPSYNANNDANIASALDHSSSPSARMRPALEYKARTLFQVVGCTKKDMDDVLDCLARCCWCRGCCWYPGRN